MNEMHNCIFININTHQLIRVKGCLRSLYLNVNLKSKQASPRRTKIFRTENQVIS